MEVFDAATMFALSTVLLVLSALAVNADIPDDVVYTDVRKIVIEGDDAVLKCQFLGTPLAVYWKKGNDPRSAPNLITWFGDEPHTGSCVKDGACEMADDFSLILKEAEMEDQGRYICRVANHNGILIYNFTDVKVIDPEQLRIHTEPYMMGWIGSSVSLPCNFTIEAKKVLWERVYWDGGSQVETILRYTSDGHEAPVARRYSWSENYGMIIRDLHVSDEGNFTCLVSSVYGIEIKNSTVLAVKERKQLNIHTEPYVTGWAGSSVSLPCNFTTEAKKVLWERVYWNGGSKVETILRYTSDGHEASAARRYSWSENYGLIIRDLHVSDEGNFTCSVSTTDGIEIKSSTVLAVNRSATQSTTVIIVVVVIVVVLVLCIFVMIRTRQYKSSTNGNTGTGYLTMTRDCFRWVFCCKKQDSRNVHIADAEQQRFMKPERELDNLRKQLKENWPGKATGLENSEIFPRVINLGVFGLMGAGKTPLINSINFALNNKFEDVVSKVGGGGTKFRDPISLTKHISIYYSKMKDPSREQIRDSLILQIRGEGELDPEEEPENGEMIHCPIFVLDIRKSAERMRICLKEFSDLVCHYYGRHVMVVVTNKKKADRLETFKGEIERLGIPEKHIWSFGNYIKPDNNRNAEKSISYLQFLQMCLEIGEKNLCFEENRKNAKKSTTVSISESESESECEYVIGLY